jgi:hypothetical protein
MNIVRALIAGIVLGHVMVASGQAVWPTTQPTRLITRETGRIVAIGERQFEMKPMTSGSYVDSGGEAHDSYIVHVEDNSKIYIDGDEAGFKDLKKGLDVVCSFRAARSGLSPLLTINAITSAIYGSIVKIDGKNVVIAPHGDGADTDAKTILTDEQTSVRIRGYGNQSTTVTLGDLRPGDIIMAIPASGTAKKIFVMRRKAAAEPSTQP